MNLVMLLKNLKGNPSSKFRAKNREKAMNGYLRNDSTSNIVNIKTKLNRNPKNKHVT